MKYEISYKKFTDKSTKREKAINDIIQYVGKSYYNTLFSYVASCTRYSQCSLACSFAGISGYPVTALWDEVQLTIKDSLN